MLIELAHFALILAAIIAVVQTIVPLVGAQKGRRAWMAVAEPAATSQVILVGFSFLVLTWAFVASDFSVQLVYLNSHTDKPLLYKISGVWGNHEGSLLLWVLILTLFGASAAWFGGNLPERLRARVLAVQASVSVAFYAFILFTSNPFIRLDFAPLNGRDLNPLLQDPGLAFHPPFLYLGYVGLSMTYSFAIAALIEGRVDPAWARWVRPWTLAAWMALTGGIALGSWWAYYELGWGGWWFWDPVENVSFMPWLAGTALLHSAIVTEKRDTFKAWTILLAILTFSLSLLGTFIVRSGLLTSVHAFAVDPERGVYILGLLAVSILGSLALFAWRAPAMEGGGLFAPISREAGLLINNLLIATACATVLFGTLYPLFLEAVTGEKISVGPPFFNASFIPITLPLVIVMGLGPHLSWKRADLPGVLARLKWVGVVVLLGTLVVAWIADGGPLLAVISMGIALWLIGATIQDWGRRVKLLQSGAWARIKRQPRSAHGMSMAHLGLAVLMVGAIGASAWKTDTVSFAEPGTAVPIAGFEVTFVGVEQVQGPNYVAQVATLDVTRDGEFVTQLFPERRVYPVAQATTTESDIRQTLAGDLYVSIAEPAAENTEGLWTLRLIYEPLVNFLWLGSLMLVLGGALSLSDRRLRVGAPRRAAPANATPAE